MRVFVIGLDGATWTVLRPLMEQGHLPCLQALCERGAHGVLHATLPPLTAVAWSSFQTGARPSRHGVYGFQRIRRTPQGLRFSLVNATHLRVAPLWESLRHAGKAVIVVNLPLTYPPRPLPGVLVTGFPTPSQRSPFTYPPELKDELLQAVPAYQVPTPAFGGRVPARHARRYVDWLIRLARARARAARYLMDRHPWTLSILQFQETDLLQHPLWHQLDPSHPAFSQAGRRNAVRLFCALDEELAALLKSLRPDDRVVVLSDHGFQGLKRAFLPNVWFARQGWLRVGTGQGRWKGRAYAALKALDVLRLRDRLPSATREALKNDYVARTIDWPRSSVYADADHTGHFGLYLLHKPPAGLLEALTALTDPQTGQRVVRRILEAPEALGPEPDATAPDYVVELAPGYAALPQLQGEVFSTPQPGRTYQVGIHHPEGIVVLAGPGIRAQSGLEAHIVDVAPTVLALLGLEIPATMDGRIIEAALGPEVPRPRRAKTKGKNEGKKEKQEEGFSPEEEAAVRRHLEEWGYL